MPVKVVKSGKKFRIVEKSTGRIAKTSTGKARDGGGHASKAKAGRQASVLNQAYTKKHK